MSIASNKIGSVLVVTPPARLDAQTSPATDQSIATLIEQGETRILIDFGGTDYISSAGLRVLLKAAKQLKQVSGAFGLCNANQQITEVLEVSGFATIMPCYASADEGVAALGGA